MNTCIHIEGQQFHINGAPTYAGGRSRGRSIEGLLLNARMIQAIFDDECEETRPLWAYPDTGVWDPERNTDEFCRSLPAYRQSGLLAVTVGLQGGGAIYRPEVYDRYHNSAFTDEGELKPAYLERLARVLAAADDAGMVVIVNYFYFKHARRMSESALFRGVEEATNWLLRTGRRNILVDLANESGDFWPCPLLRPGRIHEAIEAAQSVRVDGRRLLVGCSSPGGDALPEGRWREVEDFALPHGNGLMADELAAKLRRLKETPEHRDRPRPICVNEDSVFLDNLAAAVAEGCSWGFYSQGHGSGYRDRYDWTPHERERHFETLSGYQTPPVNWGVNTPLKQAFFERVRLITGGAP